MHARATSVRFQPDTVDEATSIFRDVMLPRASTLQGFKGAYILMSDTHPDQGIIITLWETLDDLLNSSPPEDILPDLDRLDELITEMHQDTYHVLHSLP